MTARDSSLSSLVPGASDTSAISVMPGAISVVLSISSKLAPCQAVPNFMTSGGLPSAVAHLRRQGFVLAVEARWQRRAANAEAFLGSVDFHLRVHAQDVA